MSKFISYENDVHVELALMALVATDTPEQAVEYLKAEHDLIVTPTHLRSLSVNRAERYEDMRAHVQPLKEKHLTHNLMDNAIYASEVTRQAIELTAERLAEGRLRDPSRVARDLADVQAKSVDKKLALEGRPTKITEHRTVDEIMNKLEGMRVAKRIEIEQGEPVSNV